MLGGCGGERRARPDAASPGTAPVTPTTAVEPAPPLIRQAAADQLAAERVRMLEVLAGHAETSMPQAEQGYYLDVLQAALQRVRGNDFDVQREAGQMLITLGSSTFESGSAMVNAEGQARLATLADVLASHAATLVVVHGHTDSSGPAALNRSLSQRRADAVARQLLRHGVAAARLLTVGHGADLPVADNATAEGQQANRRVELRVLPVGRTAGAR